MKRIRESGIRNRRSPGIGTRAGILRRKTLSKLHLGRHEGVRPARHGAKAWATNPRNTGSGCPDSPPDRPRPKRTRNRHQSFRQWEREIARTDEKRRDASSPPSGQEPNIRHENPNPAWPHRPGPRLMGLAPSLEPTTRRVAYRRTTPRKCSRGSRCSRRRSDPCSSSTASTATAARRRRADWTSRTASPSSKAACSKEAARRAGSPR